MNARKTEALRWFRQAQAAQQAAEYILQVADTFCRCMDNRRAFYIALSPHTQMM